MLLNSFVIYKTNIWGSGNYIKYKANFFIKKQFGILLLLKMNAGIFIQVPISK
jgi:hypothetical protein